MKYRIDMISIIVPLERGRNEVTRYHSHYKERMHLLNLFESMLHLKYLANDEAVETTPTLN